MRALSKLITAMAFAVFATFTQSAAAQTSISDATRGMERQDGFFPIYWDDGGGRLLMEISRLEEEFLYLNSLTTGIGANGLGLDRGQIGNDGIGRFTRVGPKVFFVLENTSFRARNTENQDLVRSVEESFPTSTLGAFDILAETGNRVLIDITPFVIRDGTGVAARLRRADEGNFSLQRDRSTVYRPRTKAFPINTEIEASLTFASDQPGAAISRHTPDGRSLTIRQHHSFVQLPDDDFTPRPFDPRMGLFAVRFFDFALPFDESYEQRYAIRHRLIKRHPDQAVSEPIEPIVYYMDRAIPEPYRTAFKEGLAWYEEVFRFAGFENAFRVEDMPEDMDPLDARYDVIQWVHRTEAGSSIGPAFVDPRTGEIIKAAVRMDSHRSLVDYNIYGAALPGLDEESALHLAEADWALAEWLADMDPDRDAEEFVMARRRQHAAHEIGHTLGLAHNFIAASYGRASVMDYPAPYIAVEDGRLSLEDAYRPGPGVYDSVAIRWAYAEFPQEVEADSLDAIARNAMERGIAFITNPDENPSSSHPEATTWINGENAVDELERVLAVRRHLIDRFDEAAIREGEPMSLLNTRFVAAYLHHRFAVIGAAKAIGGMRFRYALRGDPLPATAIVPASEQRRALNLLLQAIRPEALAIPEDILNLMAPRPFGYGEDNRAFGSAAFPAFDQLGVAKTAAELVISVILDPRRTARLVAFHARDESRPSLAEVIQELVDATWGDRASRDHQAIARGVNRVLLDELMALASNARATTESRAGALWGIDLISTLIASNDSSDPAEVAHNAMAALDIERFMNSVVNAPGRTNPLNPPPGTPIGNN